MAHSFKIEKAVRSAVPVLIAIAGPSGGGKTYSALELATGIQSVVGGKIHLIDTEARRSTHYSDQFDFQHLHFEAPYSPDRYLAAIDACLADGAKTIIIDQLSYEHEGQGGVLEMHEEELQKLTNGDESKRNSNNMAAWVKPMGLRRQLLAKIKTTECNFILLFRAKDKVKPVKGKGIQEVGFVPIGGAEYVYEMTAKFLLLPGSDGHPIWESDYPGEKMMIKVPLQFRELVKKYPQLNRAFGAEMAKWATSGIVREEKSIVTPESVDAHCAALLTEYGAVVDARFQAGYKTAEQRRKTYQPYFSEEQAATLKEAALAAYRRLKGESK